MSRETRTIWTCDRCGAVAETSTTPNPPPGPLQSQGQPPMPPPMMGGQPLFPPGWREFQSMPMNGMWVLTVLCYDCCEDLVEWMQQGSPYAPPGPDQQAAT